MAPELDGCESVTVDFSGVHNANHKFGSYCVLGIMHLLPETEVLRMTGLDHLALTILNTPCFQHMRQDISFE